METNGARKIVINFSVSDIIKHKDIKILSGEQLTALFEKCSQNKLDPNIEYQRDKYGRSYYALTVIKKRQN